MKKSKRLFAVMLVLVLFLAGCNGKTGADSDTSNSKDTGNESVNKEDKSETKEKSEESSTPGNASKAEEKYWVDTTEIAIEKPGQFELEFQITNENYETISTANSTADISFYSTTEGCDEGYMQTVITAKNIYRYGDLPVGISVLCTKFGPVDLYTGKAFEDYTPDDDFNTEVYPGEEMVFDTHNFTTTVDGTDYDISWYMECQQGYDDRTEVYYITYPVDYNGIGFYLSGSWTSMDSVVARADEVGGWPNMRMEDYFDFLSTPHMIDCRN